MISSFSASASLPMRLFTPHLHLIFFCHFSYRQSLPIRFVWEIFGIPADTLSDLTFIYPLSIAGQIDWHAWLTFRSLANTCPRIPVCWFLRQVPRSKLIVRQSEIGLSQSIWIPRPIHLGYFCQSPVISHDALLDNSIMVEWLERVVFMKP